MNQFVWKIFKEIKVGDIIRHPHIRQSYPHYNLYRLYKANDDYRYSGLCVPSFNFQFESNDLNRYIVRPLTKEFFDKTYIDYDNKNLQRADKLYQVIEADDFMDIHPELPVDIFVNYMKLQEVDSNLNIITKSEPIKIIEGDLYVDSPLSEITNTLVIPEDPGKEMYFKYRRGFSEFLVLDGSSDPGLKNIYLKPEVIYDTPKIIQRSYI